MAERPGAMSDAVAARMRLQSTRDTKPEVLIRRELHRRGLRYRIQYKILDSLNRRMDIAFPRERVAVDVRGCFWHDCPEHGSRPKSNQDWWSSKLEGNVQRDADSERRLAAAGWDVVVVWEHEDPVEAADRVERVVLSRRY